MKIPDGITEKNYNNVFSKHTNSSMISDILYEMGINSTIIDYKLNLGNKKLFGKAFTLKIRKLKTGENPDGIYDALRSYKHVNDGDIIVVETEVPEKAYFGELNANLALRSGAIGTIVGGHTRDIECVSSLDYPIFSKGYSSADIKDCGTLESFNEMIHLEGIEINPGDYIFADINGIVIIPKMAIDSVIDSVVKNIQKEMDVKRNILLGVDAENIPSLTGNF